MGSRQRLLIVGLLLAHLLGQDLGTDVANVGGGALNATGLGLAVEGESSLERVGLIVSSGMRVQCELHLTVEATVCGWKDHRWPDDSGYRLIPMPDPT